MPVRSGPRRADRMFGLLQTTAHHNLPPELFTPMIIGVIDEVRQEKHVKHVPAELCRMK